MTNNPFLHYLEVLLQTFEQKIWPKDFFEKTEAGRRAYHLTTFPSTVRTSSAYAQEIATLHISPMLFTQKTKFKKDYKDIMQIIKTH